MYPANNPYSPPGSLVGTAREGKEQIEQHQNVHLVGVAVVLLQFGLGMLSSLWTGSWLLIGSGWAETHIEAFQVVANVFGCCGMLLAVFFIARRFGLKRTIQLGSSLAMVALLLGGALSILGQQWPMVAVAAFMGLAYGSLCTLGFDVVVRRFSRRRGLFIGLLIVAQTWGYHLGKVIISLLMWIGFEFADLSTCFAILLGASPGALFALLSSFLFRFGGKRVDEISKGGSVAKLLKSAEFYLIVGFSLFAGLLSVRMGLVALTALRDTDLYSNPKSSWEWVTGIGMAISYYMACGLPVVAGWMLDRFSWRKPMLVLVLLSLVTTVMAGTMEHLKPLILGHYGLAGVTASFLSVIAVVVVIERLPVVAFLPAYALIVSFSGLPAELIHKALEFWWKTVPESVVVSVCCLATIIFGFFVLGQKPPRSKSFN